MPPITKDNDNELKEIHKYHSWMKNTSENGRIELHYLEGKLKQITHTRITKIK